jgi:mannose-1-phosphate guanylyltransferase/mannose-6-phosphate isomerase
MSGGSGTRLWPVSTETKPKQFHALASELSLLQDSVLRTRRTVRLQIERPIVVCNVLHTDLVVSQLAEIDVQPVAVVAEPVSRNTAAVAGVAAEAVGRLAPEALVLLMPADHVIDNPDAFWAAVERGTEIASNRIVTFGIRPHSPETGYGYIKRAAPLGDGIFAVERFLEKPDRATAERYLACGDYDWNAGIFLFSPAVLLGELARHAPEILDGVRATLNATPIDGPVWPLSREFFARCPSVSIDYAVMEHTDRAAVVPCDIGWADLGSWSELWRHAAESETHTVVRGPAVALDSQGSLVWSDGLPVTVVGLDDVVVIATSTGVLVAPKSRAQDVKAALDALRRAAPVLVHDVLAKASVSADEA